MNHRKNVGKKLYKIVEYFLAKGFDVNKNDGKYGVACLESLIFATFDSYTIDLQSFFSMQVQEIFIMMIVAMIHFKIGFLQRVVFKDCAVMTNIYQIFLNQYIKYSKPRRMGEIIMVSIGMEKQLTSIYVKYMLNVLIIAIIRVTFTMKTSKRAFSFQTQSI